MARPQAADYDARRLEMLDTAARLIAKQGFHGCSIADLAAACSISKSLLYHYFSSKEQILFEIMQAHVDALEEAIEAISATATDDRFRQMIRAFMALYQDAEAYHKVLVSDLDKLPDDKRSIIVDTERRIIGAMRDAIAQIAPTTSNDETRLSALTMLLFGMINWTHTWYRPGGGLSAEELSDIVINLFLNGARQP